MASPHRAPATLHLDARATPQAKLPAVLNVARMIAREELVRERRRFRRGGSEARRHCRRGRSTFGRRSLRS
jgi:hypothetical protein